MMIIGLKATIYGYYTSLEIDEVYQNAQQMQMGQLQRLKILSWL